MRCSKPIFCSCLLLLAACAGAPDPPATAENSDLVRPAVANPGVDLEGAWSSALAQGSADEAWLLNLGDAELESIVAEALHHNRKLAAASANLKSARQLASQAGTALASAVAIEGIDDEIGEMVLAADSFGAALNLRWERDTWERLDSAVASSENADPVLGTDLEAARRSLAAQTAKAWLLATETNLQLALSQQAIDIREQMLGMLRERGDVAAAELAAARERQRLAIGALIQALRSIAALLGRYPSAELVKLREFVPEPPAVPAGLPASLLERRPDLTAAERRVAAAYPWPQRVSITGLPSLPLTAAGGVASGELSELLGVGSDYFLHGSHFLVGRESGDDSGIGMEIQTPQQRAALDDYATLARRAFAEVENALHDEARLSEHTALLSASTQRISGAPEASAIPIDEALSLDALQQRSTALNVRIWEVRVRHARLAKRVDLHLALGGGFAN